MSAQKHLDFIVDLDGFALIFRPLKDFTELVQYRRSDYTAAEVERLILCMHSHRSWPRIDSLTASVLIQYLVQTDSLMCFRGHDDKGIGHHWLMEQESGQIFDCMSDGFSESQLDEVYKTGREHDVIRDFESPTADLFDLIMLMQGNALRFEIGEVITPENKDESPFLNEKRNMNYLYHLGVFGTFK